MRKYIFLMFLFSSISLFPNDSRIVLGSTVEIIDSENTNIIIQDEVITISLGEAYTV